jgi:hypothetical protein
MDGVVDLDSAFGKDGYKELIFKLAVVGEERHIEEANEQQNDVRTDCFRY